MEGAIDNNKAGKRDGEWSLKRGDGACLVEEALDELMEGKSSWR